MTGDVKLRKMKNDKTGDIRGNPPRASDMPGYGIAM
jgi:hypothetical protein